MPQRYLHALTRRLDRIERTRSRMRRLHDQSALRRSDIEAVYEGLFLRSVTSFEQFLADLFVAIVDRRVTYPANRRIQLRVTTSVRGVIHKLLLQNRTRPYLDWLPFKDTLERAELYLTGGRPFAELEDADKARLQEIMLTRHAVAHSSLTAREKFRKSVAANLPLLSHEKTPAGFLLSIVRIAPRCDRLQIILGDLARIGQELTG